MLRTPAPYPQVGSFALFIDTDQAVEMQRAELVRIMRHGSVDDVHFCAIALPLRAGASGNRTVRICDLLDGTPLSKDEERELTDLGRALLGRKQPRASARRATRCHALRERLIWSQILAAELRKLSATEARADRRHGASPGALLPREAGAAA